MFFYSLQTVRGLGSEQSLGHGCDVFRPEVHLSVERTPRSLPHHPHRIRRTTHIQLTAPHTWGTTREEAALVTMDDTGTYESIDFFFFFLNLNTYV